MKIEKISDTQIRCTLNKEDLSNRELKISELAYGSDKAKKLFREMMQQAASQFGFEANDLPLMIEATPVSSDCLVLVITKVEDPDELDTRFSNFTPYGKETSEDREEASVPSNPADDTYADEILKCFEHLGSLLEKRSKNAPHSKEASGVSENSRIEKAALKRLFSFASLNDIIALSHVVSDFYSGSNTLYKNKQDNRYYLEISISSHSARDFNKLCNIIIEYGKTEPINYASDSFFCEHYETILKDTALQKLNSIK